MSVMSFKDMTDCDKPSLLEFGENEKLTVGMYAFSIVTLFNIVSKKITSDGWYVGG